MSMAINCINDCKRNSTGILLVFLLLSTVQLSAQNFNLTQFKVIQSPNFNLYHSLPNHQVPNRILQTIEHWYSIHQAVLQDTFTNRSAVVLYNHPAHLLTEVQDGLSCAGSQGATNALEANIVMPLMGSNAQTDYIIGHKLVHAFQYHLINKTSSLNAFNKLPSWLVEGMAEYMTLGATDANTAIRLRNAVANNKLPSLKELTNRSYDDFSTRWGHAFWAYVTGTYGDGIIKPLFVETGRLGYVKAIEKVLGVDETTFLRNWHNTIKAAYEPLHNKNVQMVGKLLDGKESKGKINASPSLSPDGEKVAFWSPNNNLSPELLIADASSGKVVERVNSRSLGAYKDKIAAFESGITWSPDSRKIAFVVFAKGFNQLFIADAANGKIMKQVEVPGVQAFSNPTWSPDGNTIVFNGLVHGQSDLFAYDLNMGSVKQLTNDHYTNLHPSFSPDGQWLVFATDRLSINDRTVKHQYAHNIAIYHLATGSVTHYHTFAGANNLNPVFGGDSSIYFLSDRDGFRNLYKYSLSTTPGVKKMHQLTWLHTGITGTSKFAPALTAAPKTGRVMYTLYEDDEFHFRRVEEPEFPVMPVSPCDVDYYAALLPPFNRRTDDLVIKNLALVKTERLPDSAFKEVDFKTAHQLNNISRLKKGFNGRKGYGTVNAGLFNSTFSNRNGNKQFIGTLTLHAETYDVGGQLMYLNKKRRFNWGASYSYLPYFSGIEHVGVETIKAADGKSLPIVNYTTDLIRTFENQVSLFAILPISKISGIEGGIALAHYHYQIRRYANYYSYADINNPNTYNYLKSNNQKQPTQDGFKMGRVYVAYLSDNSKLGTASSISGHRIRFEASQYMGKVNLSMLTGDYRRYFRIQPFTLATRNMYLARFGKDASSNILPPLYIGNPNLVRGYKAVDFAKRMNASAINFNDLLGSRMFITNMELRLPFSGSENIAIVKSRFLFTDLNLFTDGGIGWGKVDQNPNSNWNGQVLARNATFIWSSGLSVRVNLFGYLMIEPYYAVPWQNGGFSNAAFGINFVPAW